jgi:flavin-dependent dehydrogenase
MKPQLKINSQLVSFNGREEEFHYRVDIYTRGSHRNSLDRQLLGKYKKAGGEITRKIFSWKDALLNNGTIVAADGYRSTICSRLGINRAERIGGAGICTAKGGFDRGLLYVLFNKEISSCGYSYLIPISETEATVAVCMPGPDNLPQRLKKFQKIAGQGFSIKSFSGMHFGFEKVVRSPVPYMEREKQKIYIVGDAAGTNEPLLGFGISNALASGHHCAQSIIRGGPGAYARAFAEIQKANRRLLNIRKVLQSCGMNSLAERFFFGALKRLEP